MPQGHREYNSFKYFNFDKGPWPICGYCKKAKAANRFWLDHGHNYPSRAARTPGYHSPLIWHGKHVCEECFLVEDNRNKEPFMRSTFMAGYMNSKRRGYSGTAFMNDVNESMNRVIEEVNEYMKAKNANKNR